MMLGSMPPVHFKEIKSRKTRTGKCTACRGDVRRVMSASQTVNPFNTNEHGLPKSEEQIAAEVAAELQALLEAPLYHLSCQPAAAPTRESR